MKCDEMLEKIKMITDSTDIDKVMVVFYEKVNEKDEDDYELYKTTIKIDREVC